MDLIAIGVAAANGGSGGGTNVKDGKDGYSPTVNVTEIDNGHKVNITDKNGTKSFDVLNGKKGDKGDKGDTGSDGKDGSNGKDGYTPVKGTDYWTEDDKSAIVNEVAAQTYLKSTIDSKFKTANDDISANTEAIKQNKTDILKVDKRVGDLEEAVSKSKNLFDVSKQTVGKLISSDGTETENPQYNHSDYIFIGGDTSFSVPCVTTNRTINCVISIAYYSSDKTFIKKRDVVVDDAGFLTFTTRSNEEYVILNYFSASTNFMVNLGNELLPFEEYGIYTLNNCVREPIDTQVRELSSSVDTLATETDNNTNFLKDAFPVSENLYNYKTDTENLVISASGVETSNADYKTTEFIKVDAGEYWISSRTTDKLSFNYISEYDETKKFVRRTELLPGRSNLFNIRQNGYIRLSVYVIYDMTDAMIIKGTDAPDSYIPYGRVLSEKYINMSNVNTSTGQTDIIKTSKNLINHMQIEKGYVISSSGVKTVNSSYAVTNKIMLKKSTQYTATDSILRVSLFKEDGTYVRCYDMNGKTLTFTTPADFDYAIASLFLTSKYYMTWQLEEGEETEYEQQYLNILGYRLRDNIDVEADKLKEFKNWDKICFDKSTPFLFSEDASEDYSGADYHTTDGIISLYDALMENNSSYITKTAIGTAVGGKTIYQYDFNEPEQPKLSSHARSNNKPKIILASGVHPEFGGIYGLYFCMKAITENPELDDLRGNIHFIVIPTVTPSALDTKNRKNANGVDIARNFEVNFTVEADTTSNTYGGTAPLSEPEAVAVDSVLQANKDAVLFASCHSYGKRDYMIWGSCATMYTSNLVQKTIDKMTRLWRRKYDFLPDNLYFGAVEMSAPNGSEGLQACKYGIQGLTMEASDYFGTYRGDIAHDPFVYSRNAEIYLNFLRIVVSCWESTDLKTSIN